MAVAGRRGVGRSGGQSPSADRGRHRDRVAVQRTPVVGFGLVGPGGAGGHGRQVPGPGSGSLDLHHGHVAAGGCTARHGLPVLAQPSERGHVACARVGHRGRLAGPARRDRPIARSAAYGQRAVRLRRGKRRALASVGFPGCRGLSGSSWARELPRLPRAAGRQVDFPVRRVRRPRRARLRVARLAAGPIPGAAAGRPWQVPGWPGPPAQRGATAQRGLPGRAMQPARAMHLAWAVRGRRR